MICTGASCSLKNKLPLSKQGVELPLFNLKGTTLSTHLLLMVCVPEKLDLETLDRRLRSTKWGQCCDLQYYLLYLAFVLAQSAGLLQHVHEFTN